MTKNEDEKWVTKGAVKCLIENRIGVVAYQICNISDAIAKLPAVPQAKNCVERDMVLDIISDETRPTMPHWTGSPNVTIHKIHTRIEDLPSVLPAVLPNSRQAGEIKSPAQIERAIKNLEKCFDEMKTQNHPWGSYQELRRNINLLKYVLNQPQEEKGYSGSIWTDEDFLG